MEILENTFELGRCVVAVALIIAALCSSACVGPIGAVGGPETLKIYAEQSIALARIENDTERGRK